MKRTIFLGIVFIALAAIVECSQESPETKSARLAKESYVLKEDKPAELVIEDFMEEGKSELTPIGWEVEKKSGRIFLVSYRYKIYSFKEGTGEQGFFFEVDLSNDAVRNVTKEYVSKMEPLSHIYRDEKKLVDDFLGEEPSIK